MKRQRNYDRVLALGLVLCLAALLSLSTLFITTHAEHHCTGENCEICHEIEGCVAAVHRMAEGIGNGYAGLFKAALLLVCLTLIWVAQCRPAETLVVLKIRLDN